MGHEQPSSDHSDQPDLDRTQPSPTQSPRQSPRRLDWRPPVYQTESQETEVEPTAPPVRRVSQQNPRRRRPPTEGAPAWVVGLGIGALLAVILLLVVAFIFSRRSSQPEPSATPVVVTPTATLIPRPTATAATAVTPTSEVGVTEESPATAPPSGGITVGGYVRVAAAAGLSFRQSASTSGALIQVLDNGTVLEVIGGPQEADGYTWWQLRTTDDGREGWSAAGSGDERFLEATAAP
jgi:hypothetical protein